MAEIATPATWWLLLHHHFGLRSVAAQRACKNMVFLEQLLCHKTIVISCCYLFSSDTGDLPAAEP
jgi:hypothetical protein